MFTFSAGHGILLKQFWGSLPDIWKKRDFFDFFEKST
jgi:hypothetical protein